MTSTADPSSISRSARPSPWSHLLRGDPDPPAAAAAAAALCPSSPRPVAVTILPLEPSDSSPPVPSETVASSSGTVPQSPMPSDEPEHGSNGNAAASASVSVSSSAAARGKKLAWQRPSNGSIEVGPVMGAVCWPPLSESTKASPKSSASDSLKGSSDGTVSAPPGPVVSTPSPRPNSNYINMNSAPNHVAPPVRQKSNKRGGGGGSSSGAPANGVPPPQSPPPASAAATQITPDKETIPEPSPGDLASRNSGNSNWDHGNRGGAFAPQQHGGNDHHRGYGGNRRGGGGGSHRGSFGSRRDQDRGSFVWSHRGFSGRDANVQQRGVRSYHRPPPPPFLSPPSQVRHFGNPIGYPDMPSPVYYVATPPPPEVLSGLPFIAHPAAAPPPAMFSPAAIDPQRAMLLKQINYYFSSDNLCKDIFLRRNMDEQGWVPITLIAGFNRVKQLTNNIQYILDTVRLSDAVEVQGEKIRKRNDWMNWVLPPSPNHFGTVPGLQSPSTSDYDSMVAQLQTVELDGASYHNSMRGGSTHTEVVLIRSASGNLNNQFHVVDDLSEDENGQDTGHINSDYSNSGRSLLRSDTL